MLRRWERVLIALAVCLPVPVLAATGLSIPLPATVERLAAALVPWAGAANVDADESFTVGADGAIVLARHELAGARAAGQPAPPAHAVADRSRTATSGGTRPEKEGGGTASGGTRPEEEGGTTGGGTATSGGTDGTNSGSGGGVSGSGRSGDGDSGGNSDPVGSAIDEAGSATQPVVDAVEETVDDPAGTVGGVVEDAGEAADGLLPVAGP